MTSIHFCFAELSDVLGPSDSAVKPICTSNMMQSTLHFVQDLCRVVHAPLVTYHYGSKLSSLMSSSHQRSIDSTTATLTGCLIKVIRCIVT